MKISISKNLKKMAHSDQNLKKIADFLKEQERDIEIPEKVNQKTEQNEEGIDQIHKFLEDQSNFEEKKEGTNYLIQFIDLSIYYARRL